MNKGPYQNNGACPWYTSTTVGTPPQELKFALDSGTNILWSTSSMCAPDSCQHYAGGRFYWEKSTSYEWIQTASIPYSFGPWGTMDVVTGKDVLGVPGAKSLPIQFYLSAGYDSPEFAQIDWDGGLGIPSGSAYVQRENSFIVEELMNNGSISPTMPLVSFDWNPETRSGSCEIGGLDKSKFIEDEGIFMQWMPYTEFKGVEYIWTTSLDSYSVGGTPICPEKDLMFAFDSGASRFKGDNTLMTETLALVGKTGGPPVTLGFGDGEMTVTSDMYMVEMEEGPDKGEVLPQFKKLGLTNLALVGSVIMEYCYVVYGYTVSTNQAGRYILSPKGMWAFNKPGLPKLITKSPADMEMPGPCEPTQA
ncbi:MAG: pepsin-like aspartic protease [Pseudomonadota bacterium]